MTLLWWRRHPQLAVLRPAHAHRTLDEVAAVRRPLLSAAPSEGGEAPHAFPARPPLPGPGAVVHLRDRADRELAIGLARALREIAALIAAGVLPRWLMVAISPSVSSIHHAVREFVARREELRACGKCAAPPAERQL